MSVRSRPHQLVGALLQIRPRRGRFTIGDVGVGNLRTQEPEGTASPSAVQSSVD
jgi:hypothetical protein